jgi:RHS repeat-associated protein
MVILESRKGMQGKNQIITKSGAVAYINEYYPFGLVNQQTSSTQYGSKEQRYKYNGKELFKDFKLEMEDYGARMYSPQIGRWNIIDKMAEKYPELTSYHYAADNPIKFIDPDGQDIIQFHAVNMNSEGSKALGYKDELSANTSKAVMALLATKQGYAFFAQFAKKGDKLGSITFNYDGEFSNHDLVINDYSFESYDDNIATDNEANFGATYNSEKNNLKFKLNLMSRDKSTGVLTEELTHETQLHGWQVEEYGNAFNKGGKTGYEKAYKNAEKNGNEMGQKDHQALKNKDFSNNSYKRYQKMMGGVLKNHPDFKDEYDEAGSRAQNNY